MKEEIKKIREIQLVAAALLQLEPEMKISQANSGVVDMFVDLPIDDARFAVMAWPLDSMESDAYSRYKADLINNMGDLNGCPLFIAHYNEEQGLMISTLVSWNFENYTINQSPVFRLLTHKDLISFFDVIRRQDHQIKILRDNSRMVIKSISLNEDRRGLKCKAEMIYLREFTPQYKMNTKPVTDWRERFDRNLNGQPQDEYPHDLLDDKILESVRLVYPDADVYNSLLVTSTEYRSLLRYRNYQTDYAEFRFFPDLSFYPVEKYPYLGRIEGAKFTVDIFMLLRPDKNAFANEGFEYRFPLEGWFGTLSQLVQELNTMHSVKELIK